MTGFRPALRSEWTKFRTTRSQVGIVLALGLSFPALAVLVAATGSLQPDDTVLGASLLGGAVLAQLLAAALGALVVTGECTTGTIAVTLTACPRRLVVLAAKAGVVGAVVAGVALPSAAAAFALGRLLLDDGGYAPGTPFPALLGVAVAVAALGVLGVAIGTVVRHSGGAVALTTAVVLLPGFLAPLLGDLQRWVRGASLDAVLLKLTQSSDASPETVGRLGAWPSLGLVIAYTVVAGVGAAWALRTRDV